MNAFTVINKEKNNEQALKPLPHQEVTFYITQENQRKILHKAIINQNQLQQDLQNVILQMHLSDIWLGNIGDGKTINQKAQSLKIQGNNAIKAKDYKKAIQLYTNAYSLIINDVDQKSRDLKLSLLSNLALATLNNGEFKSCIQWCNTHLIETLEPNSKVVYRRASANKNLKNWAQARKDIQNGIKTSPDEQSTKNFQGLLVQMQKQQKQQAQKQKAVYGKMFN